MSKHQLLDHWPTQEFVRNVANFIGFVQFYRAFIPYFEVGAKPLRDIMQHEYTLRVGDLWTPAAAATFDELCQCNLCNPCLCLFNHRKLTVLWTNILSQGFGYVMCQPDDDNEPPFVPWLIFARGWAISICCHMLFDVFFSWVTSSVSCTYHTLSYTQYATHITFYFNNFCILQGKNSLSIPPLFFLHRNSWIYGKLTHIKHL